MDFTLVSIIGLSVIILCALIVGFKKVVDTLIESNQKQQKLEEFLQNTLLQNQENIKSLLDENIAKLEKNFSSDIETLNQIISESKKDLIHTINDKEISIVKELGIKSNFTSNKIEESFQNAVSKVESKSETATKEILTQIQNSSKNINNDLEMSSTTIMQKLDNFLATQDKNIINMKSKLESTYSNMVHLVNNLRLDNLINVSNEIGKYKEGIYEDDHFLQEVGHCKIIKLTDKNSGEVTNVHYDENGKKSHTETFNNDTLKYTMKYENGKLKNGIELNHNGEISFEYIYDEAEEVSQKIEYIYDENAQFKEKKETKY